MNAIICNYDKRYKLRTAPPIRRAVFASGVQNGPASKLTNIKGNKAIKDVKILLGYFNPRNL